VPAVLALPLGLLLAQAYTTAAIAVVAGPLFLLTLVGVSALITTLMQLVLRDRRRGELVTLALILVLPLVSLLPSMIGSQPGRRARPQLTAVAQVLREVPSEVTFRSIRSTARGDTAAGTRAFLQLAVTAIAVHALGLVLFARVLASPGSSGARTTATSSAMWSRVLPGVTSGTSAVALALVRLAVRTPRGRAVLLSPLLLLVFLSVFALRSGSFTVGPFASQGPLGVAMFASFIALIAPMPISLNQFGVDRAGLTLTLLAPLTARQILAGKAIGTALVALPPALITTLLTFLLFRTGDPMLWLALLLSLVATYTLASPAASALSIVFPRDVDMNSVGSRSNAHALASVVGMAVFGAAALPSAALTLVATRMLGQPALAPLLIMIWIVVALGIAKLLFVPVERLFESRRESFALLLGS
jgi:hypothetical protein